MRAPPRLLALPACAALTAGIVCGTGATPAGSGTAAFAPVVAVAGSCSPEAATAVAAARAQGVAYDVLADGTFSEKAVAVGSRAMVLDAGEYLLSDFEAGKDRLDAARVPAGAAGVVGRGSDVTTIALRPDSSTRASRIPATEYEVNPLNVLRITSAHPVVGGFTLTGSPQGHTYNGLRIERSTRPRVSDVRIVAIPGDMDRPPGETFGINDYRTAGAEYDRIEVDGAGVGAAGFAANASRDVTVCDAFSHDHPVSMGFTFSTVEDVTLIDATAADNGFAGFNFERVSGELTLVRPAARGNRWDMRVVSDLGSAAYTIVDPNMSWTPPPGRWTVEVPSTYWGNRGEQSLDDIHLIVGGEERPDLLDIVVPY